MRKKLIGMILFLVEIALLNIMVELKIWAEGTAMVLSYIFQAMVIAAAIFMIYSDTGDEEDEEIEEPPKKEESVPMPCGPASGM